MNCEKSFQFEVLNINEQKEKFYSPTFTIENVNWKLLVFPKGNNQQNYISIYLECQNPPVNNIHFTIFLQEKYGRSKNIISLFSGNHTFTENVNAFGEKEDIFGFQKFVPIESIKNYSKLIFGVDIKLKLTNILKDINKINLPFSDKFNNPIFSDVKFIIDNKILYASKFILCSFSSYFYAMFKENKMKEYYNDESKPIPLKEVNYQSVFNAFKYIYTGEIPIQDNNNNINVDDYIELYKVADMYIIEKLRKELISQLLNFININNFQKLLFFAKEYDLKKLWEDVIKFICNNWESIKYSEQLKVTIKTENSELLYDFVKDIMKYK